MQMDILSTKIVKTRKIHKCNTCLAQVPAGSKMERTAVADEGSVYSWYVCETCQEIFRLIGYDSVCDEVDGSIPEGCISDLLNRGETAEHLLVKIVVGIPI